MHYQQPVAQQPPQLSNAQMLLIQSQRKSPGVAILLGLLLAGGGQMYVGKVGRGFAFLGGTLVAAVFSAVLIGIPFLIGLWIWSLIDANTQAQQYNAELVFRAQNPGAFPGLLTTDEAIAYNQLAAAQPTATGNVTQQVPAQMQMPQPPKPAQAPQAMHPSQPAKPTSPMRHVIEPDPPAPGE